MKSITLKPSALIILLTVVFGACTKDAILSNNPNQLVTKLSSISSGAVLLSQVAEGKYIKDAYIVVLKDDVANVNAEVEQLVKGLGGAKPSHIYKNTVKGFSIKVPAAAIQGLLNNSRVKYIEQDQEVTAVNTVAQSGATWGLDRVDQRSLPLNSTYSYTSTGSTVDGYIFDTGIRQDHEEFTGRIFTGFFDQYIATSTNDGNGHGTHVAGTVGGTVYGIAKGIKLYPVKILGDDGSGSFSGVIAGVDWAAGHHNTGTPAVGNMSLGGGASTSVDDAVRRAVADGIVMCVAAGNSSADASRYSPARTAEAITVGATTSTDARASYSNYGSVLDIFAPGSAIRSAWYTSTTATNSISGTSMASPHVAGVAALYLEQFPGSSPAAVEAGLKASATPNLVTSAGTGSPNLLLYSGSFTDGGSSTLTKPAAPTLSSPGNGQTSVSTSPTLSWSAVADAASYDAQVSTNNGFTSLVKNVTSLKSTSYLASKLRSRTTYYWRVRSKSSSGVVGDWAAYRSFTTK